MTQIQNKFGRAGYSWLGTGSQCGARLTRPGSRILFKSSNHLEVSVLPANVGPTWQVSIRFATQPTFAGTGKRSWTLVE